MDLRVELVNIQEYSRNILVDRELASQYHREHVQRRQTTKRENLSTGGKKRKFYDRSRESQTFSTMCS